ncbi:MAG: type III pantothenate kinase [Xanthomonadales bacterium]|nr:type III pantothenate kinase [Xanthomonadales bacterium]
MPDRTLLIDLGNTRVKWAWSRSGAVDTDSAGQGDEAAFERACREAGGPAPGEILLSSVAGERRTQCIVDACGQLWNAPVRRLRSRARQGGVRCAYADPARLGVDRWLALVGAVAAYGKPVVVWDLGTAATLDAVNVAGQHLGGLILPGPETMRTSLAARTKLNVPVSLEGVDHLRPGCDTRECIAFGIMAAQVGAVRVFLEQIAEPETAAPRLVVTGGGAATVRPLLERDSIHDPWLVFRGMLVD